MSARNFVLWEEGERTHIATRNFHRQGLASWRNDEASSVPADLVGALGSWQWQTPVNGPFPAFSAERIHEVAAWLVEHGYTARVLDGPPA